MGSVARSANLCTPPPSPVRRRARRRSASPLPSRGDVAGRGDGRPRVPPRRGGGGAFRPPPPSAGRAPPPPPLGRAGPRPPRPRPSPAAPSPDPSSTCAAPLRRCRRWTGAAPAGPASRRPRRRPGRARRAGLLPGRTHPPPQHHHHYNPHHPYHPHLLSLPSVDCKSGVHY